MSANPPPGKAEASFGKLATPTANELPNPAAPYGAVCNLPLPVQVSFHRKLLLITALQLGIVTIIAAVLESSDSITQSINDSVVSGVGAVVGLVFAFVVSIVLLYNLRAKHPFNWIALAVFSAVQIVGMLAIDVALGSHSAVINGGFTCLCVAVMALASGWTKKPQMMDTQGSMHSPYLLALIGGAVSMVVFALLGVLVESVFVSDLEIVVSVFVQLAVLFWFCHELEGMHKAMSPDEYMRGVIYLYTDLLAVAAVLVLCFAAGDAAFIVSYGYVADAQSNGEQEQQV